MKREAGRGGECTRSGIREYQPVVWLNTLSSRKIKYCSPKPEPGESLEKKRCVECKSGLWDPWDACLAASPLCGGGGEDLSLSRCCWAEINGVFVSLSLCLSSSWGGQEKGSLMMTHINGGEMEGT